MSWKDRAGYILATSTQSEGNALNLQNAHSKLAAMSQFILLPWEHAFSGASSKPHATARLTLGGKARNFVLKMRGGVIFFKEPSRGQVFAIPELFDKNLSRDGIGLVSRWQNEVAAGNFAAFVTKRDYFPQLPVRAQMLMILKPDGSGWMKEHFDQEWFLLPDDKRADVDVWNDKDVESQVRERLPFVQRSLLSRALDPQVLELDPPTWTSESGERIAELLVAATRLFIEPSNPWNDDERRVLEIKSHSAFSKGDIEGFWRAHALHNPRFARVWQLLEPRIQFTGVRWSEGGEVLEAQYARNRNDKVFGAGMEKWGELWRGNWAPQRASFRVQLPDVANQSAHERLEAGLLLREWLRGKMSDGEIEELLGSA